MIEVFKMSQNDLNIVFLHITDALRFIFMQQLIH